MNLNSPFSQTALPPAPETKKTKSIPRLIAMVMVVILGAALYWLVDFGNVEQKAAAKMRHQMAGITSGKFAAKTELNFASGLFVPSFGEPADTTASLPSRVIAELNAEGEFDASNNRPRNAFRIFGKISGLSQDPIDIDWEVRSLDGHFYFKLANLPPAEDLDISSLENIWFLAETAKPEQAPPQSKEKDPGSVMDAAAEADLQSVIQFYLEIGKLYFKSFKITKDLGKEQVSGQPTRHYQIAIDSEIFFQELNRYQETAAGPLAGTYTESARANLGGLKELTAELWIGQKDSLPYRLQLDLPLDAAGGKFALVLEFSDYQQPVEIATPADARNFNQALQQIFELWSATEAPEGM